MAEIIPIEAGNSIATPVNVDMNLKGTNVYVTYSNLDREGTTTPDFMPPDGFVATLEDATLKVRNADGHEGGVVKLVVGGGVAPENGAWNLHTTGKIAVHGARVTPLKLGSLTAEDGNVGMSVRNVQAQGNVALLHGDLANLEYSNITAEGDFYVGPPRAES